MEGFLGFAGIAIRGDILKTGDHYDDNCYNADNEIDDVEAVSDEITQRDFGDVGFDCQE